MRGQGEKAVRKTACKPTNNPQIGRKAAKGIPDWPTECQPVHTNFKGVLSVVMRLTLFMFAQKKFQYLDQYLARQVLQF